MCVVFLKNILDFHKESWDRDEVVEDTLSKRSKTRKSELQLSAFMLETEEGLQDSWDKNLNESIATHLRKSF